MLKWISLFLIIFFLMKSGIFPPIFFVIFRYLALGLLLLWIIRLVFGIRSFMKNVKIETINLNQSQQSPDSPFLRREKDISESARIIEDEKRLDE